MQEIALKVETLMEKWFPFVICEVGGDEFRAVKTSGTFFCTIDKNRNSF